MEFGFGFNRAESVPASAFSNGMTALLPVWRVARAPLLMAAAIVLVAALRQSHLNPTDPSLVYALVLVLVGAVDGRRAPLLAGLVVGAYVAYGPYLPELAAPPVDGRDVFTLAGITLVASLLVGGLAESARQLKVDLAGERAGSQLIVREKTDFLNAAAHELRTPLTVIVGYLSMLRDGNFGPPSARWLGILEAVSGKAQELSRLTDQMLLSARLDSGTAPTAAVVFDLRDVVARAVERIDPRATLLDASVSFQVPYKPVLTRADPDHIGIILDNLLANALENSPEAPTVRVVVLDEGDPTILVEDRGRGVPAEMHERIFERFVRIELEGRPQVTGPGLGLSISRDLAQRHGGTLTLARSELNLGSVFALRLPRAAAYVVTPERSAAG